MLVLVPPEEDDRFGIRAHHRLIIVHFKGPRVYSIPWLEFFLPSQAQEELLKKKEEERKNLL